MEKEKSMPGNEPIAISVDDVDDTTNERGSFVDGAGGKEMTVPLLQVSTAEAESQGAERKESAVGSDTAAVFARLVYTYQRARNICLVMNFFCII